MKSHPVISRLCGLEMTVLGLLMHAAIAFPLAFGLFALLGTFHRGFEGDAKFVYTAAGVIAVLSIIISFIRVGKLKDGETQPDTDAFLLLARGLRRVWSGQ